MVQPHSCSRIPNSVEYAGISFRRASINGAGLGKDSGLGADVGVFLLAVHPMVYKEAYRHHLANPCGGHACSLCYQSQG